MNAQSRIERENETLLKADCQVRTVRSAIDATESVMRHATRRKAVHFGDNRADAGTYRTGTLERERERLEGELGVAMTQRIRAARRNHAKALHEADRRGQPSLVMVGVGASDAVRENNLNALLIGRTGKRLLIDCGYTAKRALANAGVSRETVEGVFLTHTHADHSYGLERLAYESKIAQRARPKLYSDPSNIERVWRECLQAGSTGARSSRDAPTARAR